MKKALVVIPYFGYSGAIKVELELQKFDNMNINGLSVSLPEKSSLVLLCASEAPAPFFQLVLVP